jgi:diaminopimelate decarboxylase
MASNYNTRPRAAEVMVDGDAIHVIRAREEVRDLIARERRLPS